MAKLRTKHLQQTLTFPTWGGKRAGAGRPRRPHARRSSERHKQRPEVNPRHPIHVTLRVEQDVASLRRRHAYHAVRRALVPTLRRADFRIVHISLERDHVHLLVEAETKLALSRGLQGFQITAARYLNVAVSKARGDQRTGRVFADRYHARSISSPRDARNTLNYVLNNWRRHKQDQGMESMFWDVDYFSSGVSFGGWKELTDSLLPPVPEGYQPLPVSSPQTWLLVEGWTKAGPISMHAVPGPTPT